MPKKKPTALVSLEDRQVHTIRGVRVMFDVDLAALYEVETRTLNQAVQRNPERFPEDFAFQLTEQEVAELRSQAVISGSGYGGRRYRPWVFTEHGVAMLSSVLRSETAVRVSIDIIRTFVRLRRLMSTPGELLAKIHELADTVKVHDGQIKAVVAALQKMLEAPPPAPKKPVGFHTIHPKPTPAEDGKP